MVKNLLAAHLASTHQRLIQLSYTLSRHEGNIGTPERPLSVAGRQAYAPYWQSMLLPLLFMLRTVSIAGLCRLTCIAPLDVLM